MNAHSPMRKALPDSAVMSGVEAVTWLGCGEALTSADAQAILELRPEQVADGQRRVLDACLNGTLTLKGRRETDGTLGPYEDVPINAFVSRRVVIDLRTNCLGADGTTEFSEFEHAQTIPRYHDTMAFTSEIRALAGNAATSGQTKLEQQIIAILDIIEEQGHQRMAIPENNKKRIHDICRSRWPDLFAVSSFTRAWKIASKNKRLRVEGYDQHTSGR